MAKWYVWTTIYNGGETKTVGDRKIIVKRNVIEPGTEVTKAKLKVSDEDWDALIEGGSVRPYAFPTMPATFGGSPADFIMSQLRRGEEDVSQDVLIGLAMSGVDVEDELDDDSELAETN
jgi:hypothetical protein